MNHKSWKRSLESSLNVVVAKQPRFADPPSDNQTTADKKLSVMTGTDGGLNKIVLPPMKMDKKTSISVSTLMMVVAAKL